MMETSFYSVVFLCGYNKGKAVKRPLFLYLTTQRLSWGIIPSGV